MSTENATNVYELPLRDILADDKLQVRRKLDAGAVAKYISVYKAGGPMPPLRVAKLPSGALKLLDGWHRKAALEALGHDKAMVEIVEVTERGARWEAARANLTHGVPLRRSEYVEVFRAYVHARQHIDRRGHLKSYRDIAQEIGGTRSYSTVRNWMIRYYPDIAARMGGSEVHGPGSNIEVEQPHPEGELLESGRQGAANAAAAARAIRDPELRGALVEELREALRIAEEAGPYELPEDSDDF